MFKYRIPKNTVRPKLQQLIARKSSLITKISKELQTAKSINREELTTESRNRVGRLTKQLAMHSLLQRQLKNALASIRYNSNNWFNENKNHPLFIKSKLRQLKYSNHLSVNKTKLQSTMVCELQSKIAVVRNAINVLHKECPSIATRTNSELALYIKILKSELKSKLFYGNN